MKKMMIVLAMMLGSQLFAQEVPTVLNGLDFETVTLVTDKGEEFTAYIVEDSFKDLIKSVRNFKVVDRFSSKNAKYKVHQDNGFEFLVTRGFGLKSVTVYKL